MVWYQKLNIGHMMEEKAILVYEYIENAIKLKEIESVIIK